MKLLIGSVTKCEEIKQAVLSMDLPLTYQGKKGLLPELGGIFYNVTCG